jgi:hypothetical protein
LLAHQVNQNDSFYTIIKAGGKSTQLLEVLSAAIQAPVMLLDERFQIMNHFDLPDAPTRITSILNFDNCIKFIMHMNRMLANRFVRLIDSAIDQ